MKIRKNTPGYIDGRSLVKKECKDCNKIIDYRSIRCKSCSKTGKLNSGYKDGRTTKIYYCKDCGKRIRLYTAIYCKKCSEKLFSGKNSCMFGKIAKHGIWGEYNGIKMRSSYELNFAKWCNLSYIKWEYEPNTFDLGDTTYTPDFYLAEFDLWIEIKGYWRDDAKKKYNKFLKLYPNIYIKVFNEKRLKNMRILT